MAIDEQNNQLSVRQLRFLQSLNSRKAKGEELTDKEEAWRLEATLAMSDGRGLSLPFPDEDEDDNVEIVEETEPEKEPEPAKEKDTIKAEDQGVSGLGIDLPDEKAESIVQGAAEAVAEDINEADAEEEAEEMTSQEAYDRMQKMLYSVAEEQGIADEVKEAKESWDEVYLNAIDGKVFAYRPLLFDDMGILKDDARAIDNHKAVAERCVVAGAANVFGKRPKFGVFSAIYGLVMDVSGGEPDVGFIIEG